MANIASSVDLGALYGAARQRITALVTADGVDLETMVPSTPYLDTFFIFGPAQSSIGEHS